MEDLADGRVRDNLFMFLRDRCFVGEGRCRLSDSEEIPETGLSPIARTIDESRGGVKI